MGQPLRVDVPGLHALGSAVAAEGAQLGKDVKAVNSELAPASAPPGWATTAVLAKAGQGWVTYLTGLSARITRCGESLTESANTYEGADLRAADRHTRTGGVPI